MTPNGHAASHYSGVQTALSLIYQSFAIGESEMEIAPEALERQKNFYDGRYAAGRF
jgi:hypothetical protein